MPNQMRDVYGSPPPLLVLEIDYRVAPDVREAGLILERFGYAYNQRYKREGAHLAIDGLYISSLIANLRELIDGVSKVLDAIGTLERFQDYVREIAAGIETLKQANGGALPSTIRTLIAALVNPLRSKKASTVTINIYGSNDGQIVITTQDVESIVAGLASRQNQPSREMELTGIRNLPKLATSSIALAQQEPLPRDRPLSCAAEIRLVGDEWFASTSRYPTLFPVSFPDGDKGLHATGTQVEGTIEFENGIPIHFSVESERSDAPVIASPQPHRWVRISNNAPVHFHPVRKQLEITAETESGHRQFVIPENLLLIIGQIDYELTAQAALRVFQHELAAITRAAELARARAPRDRIIELKPSDFRLD